MENIFETEVDNIDESLEVIKVLADETVDGEIDKLEKSIQEIINKANEAIEDKGATITTLTDEISKLKEELKTVKEELTTRKEEIADLETALSEKTSEIPTTPEDAIEMLDKIARGIVKGTFTTGLAVEVTTEEAKPEKPKKELKKISLAAATSKPAYSYVYGIERAETPILHIIKKDDWDKTKDLSREGRVDVTTMEEIRKAVPFKRDRFLYILKEDMKDSDIIEAINNIPTVDAVFDKEVQTEVDKL